MVLTQALGQKVLDELSVISNMQHTVDTGVHQLLLLVAQILADVLRDKNYVALQVDHKEEAIQSLMVKQKEERNKATGVDECRKETRRWKYQNKRRGDIGGVWRKGEDKKDKK